LSIAGSKSKTAGVSTSRPKGAAARVATTAVRSVAASGSKAPQTAGRRPRSKRWTTWSGASGRIGAPDLELQARRRVEAQVAQRLGGRRQRHRQAVGAAAAARRQRGPSARLFAEALLAMGEEDLHEARRRGRVLELQGGVGAGADLLVEREQTGDPRILAQRPKSPRAVRRRGQALDVVELQRGQRQLAAVELEIQDRPGVDVLIRPHLVGPDPGEGPIAAIDELGDPVAADLVGHAVRVVPALVALLEDHERQAAGGSQRLEIRHHAFLHRFRDVAQVGNDVGREEPIGQHVEEG
jgi:hypothetical protein